MGALYVLEGSILDGIFIKQMLEKSLNLPDGKGLQYFEGYGKTSRLF
ncbi:MAG: heme oxygenase [Spirosomataceae bacterium]|jgi:heme oxygenase